MPNNRYLRSKLLLACVALVFAAHGATPLANPRVRALGNRLMCQCGCYASVTECNMINCHSSEPIRARLLSLVEAGKSDQEIIDTIVAENGLIILRQPPTTGFFLSAWLTPFAMAGFGILVVAFVLRMYLRKQPAPVPAGASASATLDPQLEKYRDQMEKELRDLD